MAVSRLTGERYLSSRGKCYLVHNFIDLQSADGLCVGVEETECACDGGSSLPWTRTAGEDDVINANEPVNDVVVLECDARRLVVRSEENFQNGGN
jgi:hypothetical protein